MAALKEVPVPDIGDFTDVPVVEVLVKPGDKVAAEDPLVTLESDKASMDVPAPVAGTVKELKVAVGDKVSEGSLLLVLEVSEDGAGPEAAAQSELAASDPAPAPEKPAAAAAEKAAPAAAGDDSAVYASPSVRRLSRERGIDLRTVSGSGRKGRITKQDLDRAPSAGPAGGDEGGGLGLAPWPQVDFAKYGEIERVELPKIRKISAANLARNWVRIPHVTHQEEADITELEAFRKQLNAEQSEVKVTMVALLLKACVASLKAFPEVNSSLDGDQLVLKRYYHLAFAADTPQGLVVPVIRDVDSKGLLEIAAELTELSGKAREGKVSPAELSGGTFTISSLGGIGGTGFTPIVNAPEVAILGVTRSAQRPVWDGEQFVPRLILPLSLSYDHRVVDGAAAARFCAHLSKTLTDLRRILL